MLLKLSPKAKRNLLRILPFGVIWVLDGWIFLFSEQVIIREYGVLTETEIPITWPVLIFGSSAIYLIGLLVGCMEVLVFANRLNRFSLSKKIVLKFLIYASFLLSAILITYPIAASLQAGVSPFDRFILEKTMKFFGNPTSASTILQLFFSLFLSLLYSAISENLGHQVLFNFFTGKYHKPLVEKRIFMFLDMKSSTTIAEQLGHVRYFDLLQKYYNIMSDAIIHFRGEVYQYIGDEVVVTWEFTKGVDKANCIECYFALKESMQKQASKFEKHFGVAPDFKAGIHLGEVTTGEMGALKKEIVFTGDVLNTTARIQGLCKKYQSDLIISEELMNAISDKGDFQFFHLDALTLRGKTKLVNLFSVSKP